MEHQWFLYVLGAYAAGMTLWALIEHEHNIDMKANAAADAKTLQAAASAYEVAQAQGRTDARRIADMETEAARLAQVAKVVAAPHVSKHISKQKGSRPA